MEQKLINDDITRASTLPSTFYSDQTIFEAAREKIFTRSWQFMTDSDRLRVPGTVLPWSLLPGYIDEPLVFTRDDSDRLHCLSNVCTHRGNLLVEGECHAAAMRCRYHGRRFGLDGCFLSTPGFEQAVNFPSADDNLAQVPFGTLDKFMFASINPAFELDDVIGDMRQRLAWMPFEEFKFEPSMSRDYIVQANWALYCENYLEGFHIPYVHPALAATLDVKDYRYELHPYSNLQIGVAASPGDAFDLPSSSPEHGSLIAAYYYWLFPNMMFNFYPWGLSVNVVVPMAVNRSKVCYYTYVWDRTKLDIGAGANVDRTEREDEDIVEKVQLGMRSHFYKRGRYSPEHEKGVHHFHQLLTRFLA
jgi:choline monooxygenase